MELKDMTIDELEARKAQIAEEVETEGADLDALTEEVRAIKAELESRKEAEAKRVEIRTAVAQGEGVVTETPVVVEERETMKDTAEIRNSKEYIDAYAEYMKTGNAEEIRTVYPLLTENVSGDIAVPEFVYDIIKTAWDSNDIMSLVNRVELKGNLKVNFEISGSDAVVHTEGGAAVDEEELLEGIVTMVPAYVKKWKSFSDEVMSMRGEAFVRYIYDELAYRIVKKIADQLIALIAALPTTATSTSPSAQVVKAAPAVGTIAAALGQLSDEATNPVVVMNKATWSAFKAAQYANGFSVDPFEGLAVHFNNSLPAFADASEDDVYAIVGDFGQGAIANFPNGEDIEYTFDELSRKKEDLVEVLGKVYVAVAPVACGAFVNITAPAAG